MASLQSSDPADRVQIVDCSAVPGHTTMTTTATRTGMQGKLRRLSQYHNSALNKCSWYRLVWTDVATAEYRDRFNYII